ncbi:hypothetical protein ACQKGO_00005, partial [Corallococcus interemptor]|uniref:hypothetical protein n=1 Tax=Corallococcus interemptor TaxID=2316720 RepID=UPI003CFCAEDA
MTPEEGGCCVPGEQRLRRRVAKDPTPRFKGAEGEVLASAERLVPPGHLARKVREVVKRFELGRVEAGYS